MSNPINIEIHNVVETFTHLGPNGTAIPLPVNDSFWEKLATGGFDSLGSGRLVSTYDFKADWNNWEMHPEGEELVVLLSGAMDFVLAVDDHEKVVALQNPGQFLVVPRGIWHTANIAQEALALFITQGENTQHRAR
ncbi:hypothetical protein P3G55_20610 [Leptospira sp. 96542]|nr:hypothetical protein [Leptospira sp. 96542]